MGNYIQLTFQPLPEPETEILIASLSETGFEGFEEGISGLKAFIAEETFREAEVGEIASRLRAVYTMTVIAETNWNEVWESNFEPVIVDDFVAIRAHFHAPIKGVEHEIIITPKMSFGTGHHATTWLMMQQMRELTFTNKKILDFGTGTGVLAILAARLGARKIIAIDNDDWSIDNAAENIERNDITSVSLLKAGSAETNEAFDIILANINKHVILENMGVLRSQLAVGGILLLSGLLTADEADIVEAGRVAGLRLIHRVEKHNWLLLKLSY